MNSPKNPYRDLLLNIPQDATREDLVNVLQNLVDADEVSADAIHTQIQKMRALVTERAKYATETGPETERKFREFLKEQEDLSTEQKETFSKMMTIANYEKAVKTAQQLDQNCKIPSIGQIAAEIRKFNPQKFKDICEIMEQPKLIIVPNNSFDEKIVAMERHQHHQIIGMQEIRIGIENGDTSPYKRPPKIKKARVSIVDGVVHPKQYKKVSSDPKKRRQILNELFSGRGLRHIDKDEYAVLIHQSIIEIPENNDFSRVIDNWKIPFYEIAGRRTQTILDPDSLAESWQVACACFDTSGVISFSSVADLGGDLRGRAATTVMEF